LQRRRRSLLVVLAVITLIAGGFVVHAATTKKVKRRAQQLDAAQVFANLAGKQTAAGASPAASGASTTKSGHDSSASTSASGASHGSSSKTGSSAPTPVAATPAPTTTVPLTWTNTTIQLPFDGLARSYYVVLPSPLPSGPVPVVMALSGSSVTGLLESQRMVFRMVTGPAIVVYPNGWHDSWNAGDCCDTAQSTNIDDVGFISAVVTSVLAHYPQADAKRVYLAGYSNGAKMALRLACQAPGPYAAVAVYGSTASLSCPTPPAKPVELLVSTGDPETTIADQAPIVINGFTEPTVAQEAATYRRSDGCSDTGKQSQEGVLTITTWSNCAAGQQVAVGIYQGGSHAWPQQSGATPSAQAVMWQFFTQFHA
jgi:polyhydroxybutyrate depolymerase